MFEHHSQKPISRKQFVLRLLSSGRLVFILISISLAVGMIGYHFIDHMTWVDALLNASMILGGMGPVSTLNTDAGKIFASIYALYSGLLLIAATAILLVPIIHRILHKFHYKNLDQDN